MDKLFLVKNIEDDYDNGTILSICSSEEAAERMADVVKHNFGLIGKSNANDFIVVEEIDVCSNFEVLWDLYPNEREKGFTYAE